MKNIYEIIGKIIIAQNAQKFSRKEVVKNTVSEHVRISIYRQIVGIVVSLNMNKDVEMQQRITTLHAAIVEHFQQNTEAFAILMNAFSSMICTTSLKRSTDVESLWLERICSFSSQWNKPIKILAIM